MYCAIPRTVCQMQSWKRPVDCTTSETRTRSGGSKPNENLIPEKVYSRRLLFRGCQKGVMSKRCQEPFPGPRPRTEKGAGNRCLDKEKTDATCQVDHSRSRGSAAPRTRHAGG